MKSHGIKPSAHRRTLSWLALGAAVTLGGGMALSACVSAGSCEDDCEEVVAGGSGGGDGSGGGGGSTGGRGGGGGSSNNASPPTDLAVADCDAYATIDEVEKNILAKSCGLSGCHASMSASAITTSLKPPGVAARLLDKNPKGVCKDDKLVDGGDWEKSVLLVKLGDTPKCSDGSDGGEPMVGTPPISADDKKCLEGYVKALVDWSKGQ